MKKILTSILLSSSIVFCGQIEPGEYVDLGVEGHLYDIVEEDFHLKLLKEVKESGFMDIDHSERIKEEIQSRAIFNSQLGLCSNDKTTEEIDYATVPEDIYNPLGRLIYKKGTKLESTLKTGQEFSVFFIDGRNAENVKNQIKFLKSEYKNSFFVVNSKNTLDLQKEYPNEEFFPSSYGQEGRFKINCYPTRLDFVGNKVKKSEFSYDRFNR